MGEDHLCGVAMEVSHRHEAAKPRVAEHVAQPLLKICLGAVGEGERQ
jgi:hypothetical protein